MARPRNPWRRVSRGLLWMIWGVFLLLTTLDVLAWSFWGNLLTFWPVLLVMLGVRLIFERSPAPWGVILSPLLLAATMSWVALAEPARPTGPVRAIHAARPLDAEQFRLTGDLAMMDLELRSAVLPAGSLVSGEATQGRRGATLSVSGDDRAPRVRVRGHRTRGVAVLPFGGPWWGGELSADLAGDLPVQVDLDMAMVEGSIDLSAGTAERVELEGAFQDLVLRLPGPVDDEVPVHLHGAFNRLTLQVPVTTPVRYTTDGFIVVVDGREKAGRRGPGYRLHVEGAFTWVEVDSSNPPLRPRDRARELPAPSGGR